ncbi:mechanosensitive ion channel [Vibrio mediterranei]|jgi:small conductance mechanosensitive channel|uniref:Small-conductance mechanosensitive channel n=1 Tax=Vibrio mediterranei TaxID=689 RepID=A0ABX5DCC4_9VIBR|nr:mechanosensitive ion channel family protein [Vibrio mediterranei]MCG9661695.1 mechanosensitive ion channel [Vibrio mediterranei]PCD86932.1 mechanosensitive ion channel protein [Vibrio mediterranei]PRQ66296.1 mechanosensitive ion channel protein [Vibrio mediterranei]
MKSKLTLVLALAIGCASPVTLAEDRHATSVGTASPLFAQMDALQQDINTLQKQAELNRFEESIIDRKNDALRQSLAEQLQHKNQVDENKQLVTQQIHLLQTLLAANDQDLKRLSDASKIASDTEKDAVQFAMQKRITAMDEYYADLSTTLSWAAELGVDISKAETQLEQDLQKRADFLYNSVLFLDSQLSDINDRLAYVPEDGKAGLQEDGIRISGQINLLILSLESSITLLENYGVDTTEYKQLLFTVTGDISTDVLDFSVIVGLMKEWLGAFKDWAMEHTPSLIVKIFVFGVILWLSRSFAKIVGKAVRKSVSHSTMKFSVLMQDFFVSMAQKGVTALGLLIALSQLGIELGPLLTGFGVAGVIIGFALQDTLSNFASGMMILIYRPFDVGDLVKVAGISGTVSHMSLVSTTIRTVDNQRLVIPNNKIWGDTINNITAEKTRRVDMTFGIGYGDDIDQAKQVFSDILQQHPKVLKSPEPMIYVHTLNESSVDFIVRPWVRTEDYWDVYWEVTEEVKKQLDRNGISIPFPQRDVHVYQHDLAQNTTLDLVTQVASK